MGKHAKRSKKNIRPGMAKANDGKRSKPEDNGKAQATSNENKGIGKMIVEGIGGGACALLSNNFFSTDHKILGVWLSFGALASFLAIPATPIAKKYSPKRTWGIYALALVLCAVAFGRWTYILSKSANQPTMSDINSGITDIKTMVSNSTASTKDVAAYFSNQWQQSQHQLTDSQRALDEVRRATQPRRITSEQREKFIKIMLQHNNLSKMPIKVIVGKTDSETENFAMQFREMLDAAGYGVDAKGSLGEAYNTNEIIVTSYEPGTAVPPLNVSGKDQELVRAPDFFVSTTRDGQSDVDVIAVFSSTNGEISIPSVSGGSDTPSVIVFYPNPDIIHDTNDIHYAYHPTPNPNNILMGVSDVLIGSGISVGPLAGKAILNPGEIGFFIPQKLY